MENSGRGNLVEVGSVAEPLVMRKVSVALYAFSGSQSPIGVNR